MKNKFTLYLGDNIESLKKLEDNSIDSIVSDPPYGLKFMGKRWDYDVPSVEFWNEVWRVLKPGGHILSFGGTRTYHRMVVNIEDAGFEIRDCISWIYGSGFPKGLNIGKAIDKLEGNEREIIGEKITPDGKLWSERRPKGNITGYTGNQEVKNNSQNINTKDQTEWEGWGTALKPAQEIICVARKPLSEKTVAENVLRWSTGGLNIDGCRVGIVGEDDRNAGKRTCNIFDEIKVSGGIDSPEYIPDPSGRFPANVILECICDEVVKGEKGECKKNSRTGFGYFGKMENTFSTRVENYNDTGDIHTNPECLCRLMDEQSGISNGKIGMTQFSSRDNIYNRFKSKTNTTINDGQTDKGGSSRFFYNAKVSKSERNMGLDGFQKKRGGSMMANTSDTMSLGGASLKGTPKEIQMSSNYHPTVKPINLMVYLCRLVTPKNGIILDPFMGSGSTGIAALLEGFDFIGMEMDEEYMKIAESRISNWEKYKKFIK